MMLTLINGLLSLTCWSFESCITESDAAGAIAESPEAKESAARFSLTMLSSSSPAEKAWATSDASEAAGAGSFVVVDAAADTDLEEDAADAMSAGYASAGENPT